MGHKSDICTHEQVGLESVTRQVSMKLKESLKDKNVRQAVEGFCSSKRPKSVKTRIRSLRVQTLRPAAITSGLRSTTETQNAEEACSRKPHELFAEVFTDHVLVYDACLPLHAQPVRNSLNAVINQPLLILSVCRARRDGFSGESVD